MKSNNLWGRIVAVAALLLLVAGGTAFAQLQTGNLYGTVTDDKGAPLPGVTVTTTGNGAPQVQVTNAQGQFRFLGLTPASYQLKAELEGFSTIDYPNIVINIGRNTQIEVKLSAAVEDVITVTAESPLLDERRISTGATVSQTELEKIPTSRDPWSVLQTAPGVLTDRINVGGNESGQQSAYVGPGSGGDQAVWSVDGVVITDMAALGSSPSYYDFDAFEEMQVTTGGSDSTVATGGVVLNMVTKRGTNEWRGSGRYYKTSDSYQSDTSFGDSDLSAGNCTAATPCLYRSGTGQIRSQLVQFQLGLLGSPPAQHFTQGNQIVSVDDYGAELGGPIIKDRLWVWGSYGKQKVNLLTIANVSDKTELKTYNGKLNAQIASNNSATAFILNSDKDKIGRNAGPTRPQETTWDQGHFGPKPTAWKAEDTHIFSSSFYLTGLYSKVEGGFVLAPEGGLNVTSFGDITGTWHNTFLLNSTLRPQTQYKADASNFFNTGAVSHELKFGAGYRQAEVTSLTQWGGAGINLSGPAFFGLPNEVLAVARNGGASIEQTYKNLYLQDTLTSGNLTANIGVRYDTQGGNNLARSQPASSFLPDVLPAVSVQKQDIGFEWKDFTPRLGLTYALGAERKTLLRASYSRFADQLGTGTGSFLNTIGAVSYAYFYTTNLGTPNVTHDQVGDFLAFSGNVNPFTGGLLQSNALDSNLSAPKTDELLLGVEHALLPEFVVGVNLTYRKISDILQQDLLVFDGGPGSAYSAANINTVGRRATRADYIQGGTITGTLPNGTTYNRPYYVINPSLETREGKFLFNGDDEQTYKGASIVFNKRLSNRWMLRGNVTYSDWTWSKVPASSNPDPTQLLGGGYREGDPVLQGSGTASGSKAGVYINSKWAYSLNGLYQISPDRPWGFNVALNLNGREGYPIPYFQRVGLPGNYVTSPTENIQATTSPDSFRLENVSILDARVEKEFTFSDFGLTLGVDCFNLLNQSYALQRNHRLQQSTSDNVREITSPRIFRLGARLSFR